MARLFVLGCLRDGPRHGYLLRHEAMLDQTSTWADVKPGSIYHALHRLRQEGLVEAVSTEQQGGPARTVLGLTDEGRAALDTQIRQSLGAVAVPADPFDVALRLADQVDDRESLLVARRDSLARRVQVHRARLPEVRRHLTAWEVAAFEHVIDRLEFELDWITNLVARRVTRGEEQR